MQPPKDQILLNQVIKDGPFVLFVNNRKILCGQLKQYYTRDDEFVIRGKDRQSYVVPTCDIIFSPEDIDGMVAI